ncbi:hypothetical protein BH20ACI2_BH20ACI2_11760 [soil metagenome]
MTIPKTFQIAILTVAACSQFAYSQETPEDRIKRSLEGRQMLVKMDMPAADVGIDIFVDNTDVSIDQDKYKKLMRDNGVAIKQGSRPRITAVRFAGGGIELDLDGGGSPGRDWVVSRVVLNEPAPVARSDREIELERQLQNETNRSIISVLRNDLDGERMRRIEQDERNRMAFSRAISLRSEYIAENRKNWGSKLRIIIRSRKESVLLRDVVKALGKYAELLPRETVTK